MYIDSLHVKHLKLLKDFKLSFSEADGAPRMWTALIGENGTAKTSILQAIALTTAGSLQVNRLAAPVVAHLRDRRSDTADLEIEATYRFIERDGQVLGFPTAQRPDLHLRSTVELSSAARTLRGGARLYSRELHPEPGADPLDEARDHNDRSWFVAGYGIARFLTGPTDAPRLEHPAIDRLEPIFSHQAGLTALRFIDHFPPAQARIFAKLLRDVLRDPELTPAVQDVKLIGRSGITQTTQLIDQERFVLRSGELASSLPAVALSHGYQSVIALVSDILGHAMLAADGALESAAEVEGLVLIDEIDLYIHPPWQAGLIPALRRTFPKVQFVVTTHSPVVLSSLTPDEIVRLAHDPKTGDVRRIVHHPETGELVPYEEVQSVAGEPDPRTMTGTEIYRAFYGVDRLTLNQQGERIREYTRLATDPLRSDEEQRALTQLATALREAGVGELPTPLPRESL